MIGRLEADDWRLQNSWWAIGPDTSGWGRTNCYAHEDEHPPTPASARLDGAWGIIKQQIPHLFALGFAYCLSSHLLHFIIRRVTDPWVQAGTHWAPGERVLGAASIHEDDELAACGTLRWGCVDCTRDPEARLSRIRQVAWCCGLRSDCHEVDVREGGAAAALATGLELRSGMGTTPHQSHTHTTTATANLSSDNQNRNGHNPKSHRGTKPMHNENKGDLNQSMAQCGTDLKCVVPGCTLRAKTGTGRVEKDARHLPSS